MAVVINGNGTVTGVTAQDELNVDSNTLVVDSTNNRVGIGTTSPSNALDIYAGNRPLRIQTSDSGECGMILKNTDGEGELLIGAAEHIVLQNKTEGSDIWFGTKPTGGSNTERMRITSDGRGLSEFTAKAWIKLNQGSNSIYDSHNVSSISHPESGQTLVNFSNSMGDTDYCAVASSGQFYTGNTGVMDFYSGSVRVVNSSSSAYTDNSYVNLVVFGD